MIRKVGDTFRDAGLPNEPVRATPVAKKLILIILSDDHFYSSVFLLVDVIRCLNQ